MLHKIIPFIVAMTFVIIPAITNAKPVEREGRPSVPNALIRNNSLFSNPASPFRLLKKGGVWDKKGQRQDCDRKLSVSDKAKCETKRSD